MSSTLCPQCLVHPDGECAPCHEALNERLGNAGRCDDDGPDMFDADRSVGLPVSVDGVGRF